MNRTCPSCGTADYGTPFCVSCQRPLRGQSVVSEQAVDAPVHGQAGSVSAGFFRRLSAFFIDWLLLSIIADIVRFAYKSGSGIESGMIHLDAAMGVSAVIFLLYFTLLTGDGGQTLGKMLLGIRVRRLDGSPIGYWRAFLRTLGYFVSIFFGSFLGFLWALWDPRNQTWHDKIVGTEVVKI